MEKKRSERASERRRLIEERRNKTQGVSKILDHLDQPDPVPVQKKPKTRPSADRIVQSIPVAGLRDYSMSKQDQQDAIFLRRLEESNPTGAGVHIHKLPPIRSVLAYIAQLEDSEQPAWFKSHQAAIINSQNMEFPRMDVLTREYLHEHMRQPIRAERPCGKIQCESESMGGFRCRELVLPSETDVSIHAGWCVFCHFHDTNKKYADNLSRKKDKDPMDLIHPIHSFIVQVDVDGEYRLDKTLMGDVDCIGMYGPFPVYNRNHYVASELPNGLKCWKESDELVFRLSRTA